jgi:hypothetical protein
VEREAVGGPQRGACAMAQDSQEPLSFSQESLGLEPLSQDLDAQGGGGAPRLSQDLRDDMGISSQGSQDIPRCLSSQPSDESQPESTGKPPPIDPSARPCLRVSTRAETQPSRTWVRNGGMTRRGERVSTRKAGILLRAAWPDWWRGGGDGGAATIYRRGVRTTAGHLSLPHAASRSIHSIGARLSGALRIQLRGDRASATDGTQT